MSEALARIAVRGLWVGFGSKPVLRGIDLVLHEGESLVVIGASGAGKSVLLKTILGLIEAWEGSVRVDGIEVVGASSAAREQVREKIGMLFQGAALFDSLPVWENVVFGLLARGRLARGEAREAALAALAEVGLGGEVADRYPAELSGGMRKRVGLARAIAADPEILFFDEPTSGLDPIRADAINQLIRRTVRGRGRTALSISHDMASVRKIADRVAMLYEGRIIWEGPVERMEHSGNPYVDQFVHGRAEGPMTASVAGAG